MARIPTITTLAAARAAAEGIAALQKGSVKVVALQALHAERLEAVAGADALFDSIARANRVADH